ncbi:P-loop NTPase fold protein [Spongiimicrobium sp. 2-473A-2-J]|uniref:P-loop NTPase fold protein n=1 Tax=Eudoraea algarum TaxID=3417568 RepID=UPI003D35A10A
MTEPKYPIFLSGRPSGKDTIKGGSHRKTAKIIAKTIKSEILDKKVVGLEGEWGSGKSNVIKIIEEELGTEYYTFIFDSWGNQEDLTRKSFLEQLISQLFSAGFLTDREKWSKLENRLLSKTSTIHKQRFPKLKPYWILLTLAILSSTVLSGLYDNILSKVDLIKSWDAGPFWKPIITIYLIPLGLLIWAVLLAWIEYKKLRKENATKELQKQEGRSDTLGRIFYWFRGQEIDSKEIENVLEDEPSVKKFREYFSNIEEDINKNGKKLVIVFDNIDRLEEDKIKSLWSSIHTFFAEDTETVNSWIIVPYDKTKLNKHFDGNGFIEKTFATNFRVTPPVVTQWEAFLDQSLKDAFGEEIIHEKEKEYVVKLFDILSSETTIKPRQIINYVNSLVAQYLQWENEVANDEIKMRYLALFVLAKDDIIKSPNEEVLSRSYLKAAVNQFEDIAELDECISALTFGVNKNRANEVLLFRELQIILREGNVEKLKNFVNHAAFDSYFNKAYFGLELPTKINGLADILKITSSYLSDNRKRQYWNDFAKQIIEIETQFKKFNDNHKAIVSNSSLNLGKKVLKKLIDTLSSKILIDDESTQNTYYDEIVKTEKFLKDNQEIKIDLIKLIKPQEFKPVPLINLVSKTKKEYTRYKIKCNNDDLIDYFFEDEESEEDLNLGKVTDCLNELEIINDNYELERISEGIIEKLEDVTYDEVEDITNYLNVLKRLNNKPLDVKLSPTFYNQLTKPRLAENEVYINAFAIGLANFNDAIVHQNFINTLNTLSDENIEKICAEIEWYIDYDDLLFLITENPKTTPYTNVKLMSEKLTYNSYGSSRLLLKNILVEYSKVLEKVFDNDLKKEKKFIQKLEGWHSHFEDNSDVSKLDERFFYNLHLQEFELIKKVTKNALKHVEGLSKEDILNAFKKQNKTFSIIKSLVNNKLINTYSGNFHSAFDDYLKDIASEKEDIPEPIFWDTLMNELDARKLKTTYTSVRDIIINDRGEINENDILFFGKGLLLHGNLDKRSDATTRKIIIPMIESDGCFELFLENKTKLLKIINQASEHKETAINELQIRYNSEKYRENGLMKEIAKTLDLKIFKDDSELEP